MKNKKGENKIGIILIGIALLTSLIVIVSALTSDEKTSLQSELSNLTSHLSDLGYDWLIDYSGDDLNQAAEIEVYRENDNILITSFTNISEEGWYKVYLTNLIDGECYDNETEVMTSKGWKKFEDINFEDEIATLNNTCLNKISITDENINYDVYNELINEDYKKCIEYYKPFEMQDFEHEGEMYRIEVEKADGEIGELLVSPEHKIYVKTTDNNIKYNINNDNKLISNNNKLISNLINLEDESEILDENEQKSNDLVNNDLISNDLVNNDLISNDLVNNDLVVSPEHKVYVREEDIDKKDSQIIDSSILSSYSTINLPSKSSGFDFSLSNEENALINACGLSCGILNQTTEKILSLGNFEESLKCLSFVTNTLCSDLDNSANLPLESSFGLNSVSNPYSLKNSSNFLFTFSSSRNLSSFFFNTDDDIITTPCDDACVMQGCFDVFFCEGHQKRIKDFFNRCSCFEQLQDLPNHNSCAFESGGSTANFRICNNIFVNFNSHCKNSSNNKIFKLFYNRDLTGFRLIKISDVYDSLENPDYTFNSSLKSCVLNILTEDCSLNEGSLDQIAQSNFNASANIGTSLLCICCFAFNSNSLNDSSGTIERNFVNSSKIELICSNGSLEYFEIDGLMFNSSFQQCSGECNFNPSKSELVIINLTGFSLKNDSNMFVSTTSSIYHPSFFNFSQAFCFTSFPILKQSSSVNSEFSSILSSFLRSSSLLTLSARNFLTNADQFVSGSSSISFFNSSGIDKVKLGILKSPLNSVYVVKDVGIFKSFGKKDLSDFKLEKISEIYSEIEDGKRKAENLVFLDEQGNEVKVKSIIKESYKGRIYDVDVENDIILVKRDGLSVWSGNSNSESYDIFDLKTGKREKISYEIIQKKMRIDEIREELKK